MKNIHFSSKTDKWSTPQDFYDKLNEEFDFQLDPCCLKSSAKCEKYFTEEDDGLIQSWCGLRVFMNPPYGTAISHWMRKANSEVEKGALVVCLVPSRTDTIWWHENVIEPEHEVRFVKGRLKFGGAKNSAPFPSAIIVMRPKNKKSFQFGNKK